MGSTRKVRGLRPSTHPSSNNRVISRSDFNLGGRRRPPVFAPFSDSSKAYLALWLRFIWSSSAMVIEGNSALGAIT